MAYKRTRSDAQKVLDLGKLIKMAIDTNEYSYGYLALLLDYRKSNLYYYHKKYEQYLKEHYPDARLTLPPAIPND
jgi:hypothetical protein